MLVFVVMVVTMAFGVFLGSHRRGCSWRALRSRSNLFVLPVFFPEKRHTGTQGRRRLVYSVIGSKEPQREGEAE